MSNNGTLPFGATTPVEFWTLVLTATFTFIMFLSLLFGEDLLHRAHSLFTSPRLEVRISKATTLSPDNVATYFLPRPDGKIPQMRMQSLILTARRSAIERLGNEVIPRDGNGEEYPMHLKWAQYERSVDSITGRLMVRDSPRYITIEKDDHHVVWMWRATRYDGEDEILTLNIDPPLSVKLKDAKMEFLDLDIRFLPVEKEPHKFRLKVKSWDELDLTERTS